ncbi:MAG TPA: GIY-YIG nuclease family protein [Patescibacteria group bacterium]|jgi:putative endonuclease|nr:GIY-YIG nuclease family protein [Patescibacteria group bacterium]
MKRTKKPFTVYILRTSANTLYTGQTNNMTRRLKEHKSKGSKSARYVRYFDSVELIHEEHFASRKAAMHRETQLKTWPRAKKEALVAGNTIHLKKYHPEPSLA